MSDTQAVTNKREAPLVVDEQDNDYALKDDADAEVWIRVKNIAVHVIRTDEGVVVDLWAQGDEDKDDPLSSTYAFFAEAEDTEDTE